MVLKYQTNKMKKFIIFDFDGVIVDSKKNMELSWKKVQIDLQIKIGFKRYFKKIGIPFENILDSLDVKKKYTTKAKNIYRKQSIKNFNKIRLYPDVLKTLNILKKKNYLLGMITSKEKIRTKKLLKKFKLEFKYVYCPVAGKKGKPDPYMMNKLIKKEKINKANVYYIGDTLTDYKFAKNSKVQFIYCKYGYGNLKQKNLKIANKFKEILKYI